MKLYSGLLIATAIIFILVAALIATTAITNPDVDKAIWIGAGALSIIYALVGIAFNRMFNDDRHGRW